MSISMFLKSQTAFLLALDPLIIVITIIIIIIIIMIIIIILLLLLLLKCKEKCRLGKIRVPDGI